VKSQESNLATETFVRPYEREPMHDLFVEPSARRAPHDRTLAPRALHHPFCKPEFHRQYLDHISHATSFV